MVFLCIYVQKQLCTVGCSQNRDILVLVHKNPSYVECTRYSRNISLIFLKVQQGPQTQFNHGYQCFTRLNEYLVHMAYVSSDRACAQDGYLKRPHPTIIDGDLRWDSGWFGGGLGVGGHLTRNQLGVSQVKKHTPIMAAAVAPRPPWHPLFSTAAYYNQPTCVRQVYVIKTREYYCFYYLLANLRHDASLACQACVCWLQMMARAPNRFNQKSRAIEADWAFQVRGLPRNELVVTCAREAIVTLIYWRTTHGDSAVKR